VISPEELQEIEGTLLPTLERHHLRLLAHGLRSLQAAAGRRHGPLPDADALAAWAGAQAPIAADPGFAAAFLEQLDQLGAQLTDLAAAQAVEPLALEIADLIGWARNRADARLSPLQPPGPE
jgi:hypothetical protein